MVTRPSETSWNLGRSSMSVDFPAPDIPTNATSSPLRMESVMSRSAHSSVPG